MEEKHPGAPGFEGEGWNHIEQVFVGQTVRIKAGNARKNIIVGSHRKFGDGKSYRTVSTRETAVGKFITVEYETKKSMKQKKVLLAMRAPRTDQIQVLASGGQVCRCLVPFLA